MKSILKHLRGVVFFAGMTINTIFWFIPIFLLGIIKLLVPVPKLRDAITRLLMAFGENWVSVNTFLMQHTASVKLSVEGLEGLRRDGWYLVISNHQTWVDILVLQTAFNRRIPFLKFFIKQQLIWFPFLGIAWWAMDMPFMKRFSPSYIAKNPHMKGKDLETTRRACQKFQTTPTSVLNFIEGTRFSEQKRVHRKSPYKHLLQPRAGGLAIALSSMGELFTGILDVTLVYRFEATAFWDMCCGRPVDVVVKVRQLELEDWLIQGSYEKDREFRKKVHAWIGNIWTEKDAILEQTRESDDR